MKHAVYKRSSLALIRKLSHSLASSFNSRISRARAGTEARSSKLPAGIEEDQYPALPPSPRTHKSWIRAKARERERRRERDSAGRPRRDSDIT